MIVYDEDSFFGSGEYEVLTVSEVLEYLTEEEKQVFNNLCDKAENRMTKHRLKNKCFSRGYEKARENTNFYKGNQHSQCRDYCDISELEEAFDSYIQETMLF